VQEIASAALPARADLAHLDRLGGTEQAAKHRKRLHTAKKTIFCLTVVIQQR
jgi:hypothetical protein